MVHANGAWLVLAAMAFNLTLGAGALAFASTPARPPPRSALSSRGPDANTRSARKLMLHLPQALAPAARLQPAVPRRPRNAHTGWTIPPQARPENTSGRAGQTGASMPSTPNETMTSIPS